jgi:hypothetical protein
MSTSKTSPTSFENKVRILSEVMADTSEMFDEVRAMFDVEWQTDSDYNVAWALLLSDGNVRDTGFSSLSEIRELYQPLDDVPITVLVGGKATPVSVT